MSPFLTANWLDLVFCSWLVPKDILRPYLPKNTELDLFNEQAVISIVAFRFGNTKVLGLSFPFHKKFAEINLRFYVKEKNQSNNKGVVFIKEYAPKHMVALTAKIFFNESFSTAPVIFNRTQQNIHYKLNYCGLHNLKVQVGDQTNLNKSQLGYFCIERYFGYTKLLTGKTLKYEVVHKPWDIFQAKIEDMDFEYNKLYDSPFSKELEKEPSCILYSPGSAVELYRSPPDRL